MPSIRLTRDWTSSIQPRSSRSCPPLEACSGLLDIPARTAEEPRFLVIAQIHGKHWSAVITHCCQAIPLISVRRSRPEEAKLYEQL